jgi:predicted lipid-binding transport protein (Tim44 family)
VFDITTIIFLALAVFIFLRLRSVLGQRTGRERPPYDHYSSPDRTRPAREKVVALPTSRTREAVVSTPAVEGGDQAKLDQRWKGIAELGSAIANSLDAIAAGAPDFDVKHFLTGARAAYEMIVNAFADGDRSVLKNLLSREVYDGFESAINEREKRGEHMESHFVSIDSADIVGADRLMMGSDMPFPIGDLSPLKIVADTKFSDAERASINGGLAQKLFGL